MVTLFSSVCMSLVGVTAKYFWTDSFSLKFRRSQNLRQAAHWLSRLGFLPFVSLFKFSLFHHQKNIKVLRVLRVLRVLAAPDASGRQDFNKKTTIIHHSENLKYSVVSLEYPFVSSPKLQFCITKAGTAQPMCPHHFPVSYYRNLRSNELTQYIEKK